MRPVLLHRAIVRALTPKRYRRYVWQLWRPRYTREAARRDAERL